MAQFMMSFDDKNGRRFVLCSLITGLSIFVLAIIDRFFEHGGVNVGARNLNATDRIIFILGFLVSDLIFSMLPYILAIIAVRKKSWIPVFLLAIFGTVCFLGFLGDIKRFGFLAGC
jgi:hypothetical protein